MQECTTIMMLTHDYTDDLTIIVACFNYRFNGSWRESVMMDNACVTEEYLRLNTNCSVYSQFCEFDS